MPLQQLQVQDEHIVEAHHVPIASEYHQIGAAEAGRMAVTGARLPFFVDFLQLFQLLLTGCQSLEGIATADGSD